jgi:Uma2 family endonuclease
MLRIEPITARYRLKLGLPNRVRFDIITHRSQPIEKPRPMTITEYLDLEYSAEEKHEYVDGYLINMSGGSEPASLIATNIIAELHGKLKGKPCRVYDSNLKVRPGKKFRYRYPDALVICGPTAFDEDDKRHHTVPNPRLVVEVLSPSTERNDRGSKFADYRSIPEFEEYVLVSQFAPTVETYFRQPDGTWLFDAKTGLDAVTRLRSLGIDLLHAEVFANVEFRPDETDAPPTPSPAGS